MNIKNLSFKELPQSVPKRPGRLSLNPIAKATATNSRFPPPAARQFTTTSFADIQLILIRGLPGSGKSELGKTLAITAGYFHVEADMFFELNGPYNYDAKQIGAAHKWCQKLARDALLCGKRVVVTNTFTKLAELAPYLAMGVTPRIIEATGRWQNKHGVPVERLLDMAARWEPLPRISRSS